MIWACRRLASAPGRVDNYQNKNPRVAFPQVRTPPEALGYFAPVTRSLPSGPKPCHFGRPLHTLAAPDVIASQSIHLQARRMLARR